MVCFPPLSLCMYLFLVVLGLHCCTGFPLVAGSGDYSPHSAQASHRRAQAPGRRVSQLWSLAGFVVQGTWDLPGSGIEPMSPALAGGLFTTEPPGKPGRLRLL